MIRVLEKLLTEVVTIIRVEMSKVLIVIGRPTLSRHSKSYLLDSHEAKSFGETG